MILSLHCIVVHMDVLILIIQIHESSSSRVLPLRFVCAFATTVKRDADCCCIHKRVLRYFLSSPESGELPKHGEMSDNKGSGMFASSSELLSALSSASSSASLSASSSISASEPSPISTSVSSSVSGCFSGNVTREGVISWKSISYRSSLVSPRRLRVSRRRRACKRE